MQKRVVYSMSGKAFRVGGSGLSSAKIASYEFRGKFSSILLKIETLNTISKPFKRAIK